MINPPIVITMGEPAGVGPELTVKAKKILKNEIPFYVIGDFSSLTSVAHSNQVETKKIEHYSETFKHPDKLCIFDYSSCIVNMPYMSWSFFYI